MLQFDDIFFNEKKLEANLSRPFAMSGSLIPLYSTRFEASAIKKYWEGLPIKEKENCLTIKSAKFIHLILTAFGMLRLPVFFIFFGHLIFI